MELLQAHHQWVRRPADERFTSLPELLSHFEEINARSRAKIVSNRVLQVVPDEDNRGLTVHGPNGVGYAPTNWAFGQLCSLADAPAGFLRQLPSPYVADVLNFRLQYHRAVEEVGVLIYNNGAPILRAANGPRYGRIYNSDVIRSLIHHVGDGVTGDWRVPGIFGQELTQVTKENTTLFAGDRDCFVFLADERNRIEIPNRRAGKAGAFARGVFVKNSEVGATTLSIASFYFDYVCQNRIVWGAEGFKEINIRHTSGAPDRWLEEVQPALLSYVNASTLNITEGIKKAQAARIGDAEKVGEFIANRFGKRFVAPFQAIHAVEEERPIETLFDVATAATAYARDVQYQDRRVEIETEAGKVLELARN